MIKELSKQARERKQGRRVRPTSCSRRRRSRGRKGKRRSGIEATYRNVRAMIELNLPKLFDEELEAAIQQV